MDLVGWMHLSSRLSTTSHELRALPALVWRPVISATPTAQPPVAIHAHLQNVFRVVVAIGTLRP